MNIMSEKNLVPQPDNELQKVEEAADREFQLPTTDIRESADAFVLVTDLPGVEQEALGVSLEKGLLTIQGRRQRRTFGDEYALRWGETMDADFRRSFRIPEEIDAEKIGAELSHGVLTLTLPKSQAVSRRIEVKSI